MLALKPNCECCDRDLPADSAEAFICTFECTYCEVCATGRLAGVCPACQGNLVRRPIRPTYLFFSITIAAVRARHQIELDASSRTILELAHVQRRDMYFSAPLIAARSPPHLDALVAWWSRRLLWLPVTDEAALALDVATLLRLSLTDPASGRLMASVASGAAAVEPCGASTVMSKAQSAKVLISLALYRRNLVSADGSAGGGGSGSSASTDAIKSLFELATDHDPSFGALAELPDEVEFRPHAVPAMRHLRAAPVRQIFVDGAQRLARRPF